VIPNHNKPGAAFWATVVVVVVLVAYPLSMGPTLRLRDDGVAPFRHWWDTAYAPMLRFYRSGPRVHRAMKCYLQLWLPYPFDS